jgi:molybdate transport system ATP-binding protein
MSLELDFAKKLSEFTLRVRLSADDERIGILGSSGGGKSMTLKCVAGIETPDEGTIVIDGVTVFDSARKIDVRPQLRKTGYLFQNYALFPTLTVAENVSLAAHGKARRERNAVVVDAIRRMGLGGLERAFPHRLSGGQQQRTALARILASEPSILMLDEPLSALDSHLRASVERELADFVARFDGTTLIVSHDRDELYRACDRIAVLDGGELIGARDKRELFSDPRTVAAARLSGCKNLARAVKVGAKKVYVPDWNLALETASEVDETHSWVGVHGNHIRSAARDETTNCFAFAVDRRETAPFSASEYLIAPRSDSEKPLALRRDYAVDDGGQEGKAGIYCLPPDKILLLSE